MHLGWFALIDIYDAKHCCIAITYDSISIAEVVPLVTVNGKEKA